MASVVFEPTRESRLEQYFFPSMALLMLATVLWGFARSYFLAGMFRAPRPNVLIHLHSAAFTTWILLLITQTSLVAANRVGVHRKLGLVGFGLACLMVILGILASTDLLRRELGQALDDSGLDPKTLYIIPLTDIVIFATLFFPSFRSRFNPSARKRLILVAPTALMVAGVTRWPMKRVHRATIWASAFLILVQRVRVPLGRTGAWRAFAAWAQNLARTIHG